MFGKSDVWLGIECFSPVLLKFIGVGILSRGGSVAHDPTDLLQSFTLNAYKILK